MIQVGKQEILLLGLLIEIEADGGADRLQIEGRTMTDALDLLQFLGIGMDDANKVVEPFQVLPGNGFGIFPGQGKREKECERLVILKSLKAGLFKTRFEPLAAAEVDQRFYTQVRGMTPKG